MAEECLFCRIVSGEIDSDTVYEDEDFLAFRDINPQAPVHIIVIPKAHIASVAKLTEKQRDIIGRLIILAKKLAEQESIAQSGYRLAINCGPDGGQVVPHLHLHLLGGKKLSDWLG
ncbi:MAG: histidine triad nucleotide-binding protein [Chloroflexota bacterium]|nr:histidine triad nucleotide-binding protein [Chloroflexota bacterium]